MAGFMKKDKDVINVLVPPVDGEITMENDECQKVVQKKERKVTKEKVIAFGKCAFWTVLGVAIGVVTTLAIGRAGNTNVPMDENTDEIVNVPEEKVDIEM